MTKKGKYIVEAKKLTWDEIKEQRRQKVRDRIGLRIYTLRKMKELTQEQLADRAGIQRTHLGRIEAGKYAVTLETIQAIAEALGMTVDLIDPKLRDLAPLKSL